MTDELNSIGGLDWTPPPAPTLPHEKRLAMFLDLVDCRPEDVIDTFERCGHVKAPTVADIETINSQQEMPFGKHQGTRLCDVPIGYLTWLANLRDPKKGTRRYCKKAQAEIRRRSLAAKVPVVE